MSRVWNWQAITSMLTALTAVGALVFTGLSLNATREQTALTEQGQITDRYGKAVEQIGRQGPDSLQIRLGGIYALERLAQDSPRDQPTIIEVLSAFVRTSTKPPRAEHCSDEPPTADVQAALTVLGRINPVEGRRKPIDLRNACLARADLQGANLTGAYLVDACLKDAVLAFTRLNKARLENARLDNAFLLGASLVDAKLYEASLINAHLASANLNGADLSLANLGSAFLVDAQHNELTRIEGAITDGRTIGKWWSW